MGQLGFFDADKRLAALSAKGDPLEAIDRMVVPSPLEMETCPSAFSHPSSPRPNRDRPYSVAHR
jgi:hypothetical protein